MSHYYNEKTVATYFSKVNSQHQQLNTRVHKFFKNLGTTSKLYILGTTIKNVIAHMT
jgi:hypothetical protein